jgi:hypothetical protein
MEVAFIVRPIADENCDSLSSTVILETHSLAEAKAAAGSARCAYGAGIEDTATGQIDIGYGFGAPGPDG